jgi:Churchill protein
MCKHCLREAFPERQRTTLQNGAYLLNFAGCAGCKQRNDFLAERNLREEETDEKDEEGESIYEHSNDYEHACKLCGHKVADHSYVFRVISNGEIQEYSMSCALCGKGEYSSYSAPNKFLQGQVRSQPSGEVSREPVSFPTALLAATFSAKPNVEVNDDGDDEWS